MEQELWGPLHCPLDFVYPAYRHILLPRRWPSLQCMSKDDQEELRRHIHIHIHTVVVKMEADASNNIATSFNSFINAVSSPVTVQCLDAVGWMIGTASEPVPSIL